MSSTEFAAMWLEAGNANARQRAREAALQRARTILGERPASELIKAAQWLLNEEMS